MLIAGDTLYAGFSDPVFDSQRSFRAVLEATSHPGRIIDVGTPIGAPPPLHPATAAICLALVDFETPVWIQAATDANTHAIENATEHAAESLSQFLRFHCSSPLAADPALAAFAVIHAPAHMPPLTAFSAGLSDYPDRSTTLLVQVDDLNTGRRIQLSGPGIKHSRQLAPAGLPERFWTEWRDNGALFPRGVDVLLICGSDIAALPRTTRVEMTCT